MSDVQPSELWLPKEVLEEQVGHKLNAPSYVRLGLGADGNWQVDAQALAAPQGGHPQINPPAAKTAKGQKRVNSRHNFNAVQNLTNRPDKGTTIYLKTGRHPGKQANTWLRMHVGPLATTRRTRLNVLQALAHRNAQMPTPAPSSKAFVHANNAVRLRPATRRRSRNNYDLLKKLECHAKLTAPVPPRMIRGRLYDYYVQPFTHPERRQVLRKPSALAHTNG